MSRIAGLLVVLLGTVLAPARVFAQTGAPGADDPCATAYNVAVFESYSSASEVWSIGIPNGDTLRSLGLDPGPGPNGNPSVFMQPQGDGCDDVRQQGWTDGMEQASEAVFGGPVTVAHINQYYCFFAADAETNRLCANL